MSGLRWQSSKNWKAPEHGWYAVRDKGSAEWSIVLFDKGWSTNWDYVAGPIEIADPDPELELPKGRDQTCISVRGPSHNFTVYTEDRRDCVLFIKAGLKALEEQRLAHAEGGCK